MRERLLSCLALGLLAGAACAGLAQPGSDRAHPSATGLDPSRRADRALQAFDAAHPQCQLWTNWQKMCSRTGPDGATVCVTDPDRPVRPSEPFCTAGTEAEASPSRHQPLLQATSNLNPARAADRQLRAYGEAHPECALWTNWEKLCSRTGPGGSIYCDTDADARVAPSAPFCA